jgi:NAD(P)-dependent dehydrogenase (short-subunit alcohol dehydrogenase family)
MIDTELTRKHASDELLERLAASYPVPRLGTGLEVADLICFAASGAAGYITGASLDINGGDLMMCNSDRDSLRGFKWPTLALLALLIIQEG